MENTQREIQALTISHLATSKIGQNAHYAAPPDKSLIASGTCRMNFSAQISL